ncbi:SDR family oxidoreductase [Paraburkholderia caribensis]|uniref:SDR family oxidoreductase n=1 Tax=Paraburkholderia caribensis TaxID=75105 RepID=UPI00078D0F8D|nr:SDR family oxidoreductase [Paraburkholderia caribensis]AMV43444.1 short-chain dehydrogenase [Paraburkholderia caribensis]MDR6383852.1 short-subunit dehydrogenase [Paraburkholderia caribensis]
MKNILIVGATSAIAIACARQWAKEGARFFLVARNGERLEQVAGDLKARGAQLASCHQLDIDRLDLHATMLEQCAAELGALDVVLVAPGTLPDQAACQSDPAVAVKEFTTNATSLIALLTPIANTLEAQKRGTLAVISSVAADRGRPSNYLYGSAKAALSAFCEGLNARLFKAGAHVLTIKPGFVATPMTAGLPLPGPLVATPEKVASDILRAIDKRKDVVYTPWFWSLIMLIIRSVPKPVFKRTSL